MVMMVYSQKPLPPNISAGSVVVSNPNNELDYHGRILILHKIEPYLCRFATIICPRCQIIPFSELAKLALCDSFLKLRQNVSVSEIAYITLSSQLTVITKKTYFTNKCLVKTHCIVREDNL